MANKNILSYFSPSYQLNILTVDKIWLKMHYLNLIIYQLHQIILIISVHKEAPEIGEASKKKYISIFPYIWTVTYWIKC